MDVISHLGCYKSFRIDCEVGIIFDRLNFIMQSLLVFYVDQAFPSVEVRIPKHRIDYWFETVRVYAHIKINFCTTFSFIFSFPRCNRAC